MQTVRLRNGTDELESLVKVVTESLNKLENTLPGQMALHDLNARCLNKDSTMWDEQLDQLQGLGLIQVDGTVHDSIRNVVLSAIVSDDGIIMIQNPQPDTV